MNKSFNINVSGGNVSLGAASQADSSSVSGTSTMHVSIEAMSEDLFKTLLALAQHAGVTPETQATVQSHAQDLVQAVKAQEKSKASTALEIVQKNFSWAYPALKDFVKVAWPAVLLAIGA